MHSQFCSGFMITHRHNPAVSRTPSHKLTSMFYVQLFCNYRNISALSCRDKEENGGDPRACHSQECHGYEMLIYKHCHDKLKEVGIIVMKARPTLVVSSEVVRSSDVPVTCIVWRYCATNNVAHVKCYFDHAS